MSDTARDFKHIEPASTEGLEDLFDATETLSQSEIPDETLNGTGETVKYLTVSQVVRQMRIPRSTVYRHIQAGKYQTCKGTDGKILVSLRHAENPILSHETAWETQNETVETVEIPTETVTETNTSNIDIAELLRKLEGATYRVGYLEAQLETERQQMKLLMDSQHNRSRWTRFWSWFMGR